MGLVPVTFPSRWSWRYKHPQTTRCELAWLLNWWRKRPKDKRPWLADAWQDYLEYGFNLFVYQAGVNYLLSRPRLRKWLDEPYQDSEFSQAIAANRLRRK